jgi:ABC-type nitrate/sulfonate/bicarbonate transport system permease component
LLRRSHTWIGMLIAPSVLFFATTGALQLYSLHEAHDSYTPPALLVALGSLHKDQKLPAPPHPEAVGAPAAHEHHHDDDDAPPKAATGLLKIVFLGVAAGLIVSTLLGLWMALQDRLRRRTNLVLLAVGVVAPAALLFGLI